MNARTSYLVDQDVARLKNALVASPGSEQRCVTAVARRVLLNGPYYFEGKPINPVGKSIGAGVWAITHGA